MWRSSFPFLKHRIALAFGRCKPTSDGLFRTTFIKSNNQLCGCLFSSLTGSGHACDRALHENAEALKMKLGVGGSEVVRYSELLQACESIGVAKSVEEAKEVAKMFDDAAVIFIFRDKVYLHPHKVYICIYIYMCIAYTMFRPLPMVTYITSRQFCYNSAMSAFHDERTDTCLSTIPPTFFLLLLLSNHLLNLTK